MLSVLSCSTLLWALPWTKILKALKAILDFVLALI